MREPGAMIVAHLPGEDLHLAAEAAKGRRVDDPVAIALKWSAIRMLLFRMPASARVAAVHGIGGQQAGFARSRGMQGTEQCVEQTLELVNAPLNEWANGVALDRTR